MANTSWGLWKKEVQVKPVGQISKTCVFGDLAILPPKPTPNRVTSYSPEVEIDHRKNPLLDEDFVFVVFGNNGFRWKQHHRCHPLVVVKFLRSTHGRNQSLM